MYKIRPMALIFALLLVTQTLWAQNFTPLPISQCPSVQPLVREMALCKTPQTMTVADLNNKSMMVPMQMPVRLSPASGGRMVMQPLIITDTMPADAVMMPLMVPVKISSTPTQTCLTTTLQNEVAGTMLLMPASVNGNTLMEPVQLKLDNGKMLMLPTSLDVAEAITNVPMYVDGELIMFPLQCRTTANGITLCPRCPADEITILVR